MKTIVFLAVVAAAVAAPQAQGQAPTEPIPILKLDNEVGIDGYQFLYETGNGIVAEEKGDLKDVGAEEPALNVQGQYQYTDKEGNTFQVSYVANENGFQPQGAHIPTPPPIPPAIQRSLEILATAKPQPEDQQK